MRHTSDLFILDDDATIRDTLSVLFSLAGYRVALFAEADPFLAAARGAIPAAVLLDLHTPRKSGLTVLKELDAVNYPAPVFTITGDDEITHAVEAVKNGAYDYVIKPLDMGALVTSVGNAAANFLRPRAQAGDAGGVFEFSGRASLAPRERGVLTEISGGASNNEAGRHLGISPRTIEVHRVHIMSKIGARNAADLVRIVLGGERGQEDHDPPEMVA